MPRNARPASERQPDDRTPAQHAADFIRAVDDRTAAYTWGPARELLSRGEPVRPTRRGWCLFYQWRKQVRRTVDLRAVEAEMANPDNPLLEPLTQAPTAEGLTLSEFAEWAGVDRRNLAKHVVDIPPGPVPTLPPGAVPARRLGPTRRFFPDDLRGRPTNDGENHVDHNHSKAPPDSAAGSHWHRQVDRLRHR